MREKLFPYGEELPENSAKNCSPLSNSAHTGPMRNANPRALLAVILALVTTVAWACLIWTALAVSTVVLDTLSMIVELAAMSPD